MRGLIIKTSALGDIVHAFGAAQYLKDKYPEMTLEWVVEQSNAALVAAHPSVNNLHVINSKLWRKKIFAGTTWREIASFYKKISAQPFDFVIDLQGNCKSAAILLATSSPYKIGFGRKYVAEWPNLLATNCRFVPPPDRNVREDYLFLVKSFFKDTQPYTLKPITLLLDRDQEAIYQKAASEIERLSVKKILVCTGSAWPNKQLSIDQWSAFLQKIADREECSFAFSWGSEQEKKEAETLAALVKTSCQTAVLEKTDLAILQNLMGHFSLVLAVDSLPLHLAASRGVATFSIFGPSLAKKYGPSEQIHTTFQGSCPYGKVFTKRCPILRSCPTGACIRDIEVEELLENLP